MSTASDWAGLGDALMTCVRLDEVLFPPTVALLAIESRNVDWKKDVGWGDDDQLDVSANYSLDEEILEKLFPDKPALCDMLRGGNVKKIPNRWLRAFAEGLRSDPRVCCGSTAQATECAKAEESSGADQPELDGEKREAVDDCAE